jgi:hypothetical protein
MLSMLVEPIAGDAIKGGITLSLILSTGHQSPRRLP